MRVIAGKFGSRRLRTLRGMELRPTSDRLRETLFDILGGTVEDSLFVDVFAGSGAIGIEALSRGARQVVFIERHGPAAKLIRDNLNSLGAGGEILVLDAIQGLERLASRHALADFIFLDPPYALAADYLHVLDFLDGSHLLAPRGIVIVEHRKKMELPMRLYRLECSRTVEQGDSALSFYRLAMAA
ncbi:MAG TPA: 16S rRNA (guanine(966)-N(2))-methyltransferase RsmD [Candidatus Acidoferrales bacterium]|nr:16S rRNA (guanine(966)-N(2))-methyltransferase RsmD [Candidatus Acidoferrales bacterium]